MNGSLTFLAIFALFCRIGGCLMIAPGVGSSQIPPQVRIFVAVGATLVIAPMLLERAKVGLQDLDPIGMARLVVSELLVGGLIGVLARLFFAALETLAFASATLLGLANPFGAALDLTQPTPPLATLITLGATTMIFVADFHWQILIALLDSYSALPFGAAFDARRSLAEIGGVLGQSFLAAMRVASPFFLYSVIVNFAFALINRVTPQIAIFFVASPFVAAGGLGLIYLAIRGQIGEFMAAFAGWLGTR